MNKAEASRPGLSLAARLGILGIVAVSGIGATVVMGARQSGTDVGSYLSSLDFRKAYSRENLTYVQAELKLKQGDRKGCAALIKQLPLTPGADGDEHLSYKELRTALIEAQLTAGEFDEALDTAQTDEPLACTVLTRQLAQQGIEPTRANGRRLARGVREPVFEQLTQQYATQSDAQSVESLLPELTDIKARDRIFQALTLAYAQKKNADQALATTERIQDSTVKNTVLQQLGSSFLNAKDVPRLEAILKRLPNTPPKQFSHVMPTGGKVIAGAQMAERDSLLQSAAWQLGNPAVALRLVQTYAHPSDLPELLRSVCMHARGKDPSVVAAALEQLRGFTSAEGKAAYDQEAEQALYSNTSSDVLLPLAKSIHGPQRRAQGLIRVGQNALAKRERQTLGEVLAALRTIALPEARTNHDNLIQMALGELQRTDPKAAKTLVGQLLDPVRRKELERLFTAPAH